MILFFILVEDNTFVKKKINMTIVAHVPVSLTPPSHRQYTHHEKCPMKDKVHQELREMEQLGVIERQTEPTEWVNSMTVVNKGSKIRIALIPWISKVPYSVKTSH